MTASHSVMARWCVALSRSANSYDTTLSPLGGREDILSCDRTLCHHVWHRSVSPPAVCMQERKRATDLLQACGMILAHSSTQHHQAIPLQAMRHTVETMRLWRWRHSP